MFLGCRLLQKSAAVCSFYLPQFGSCCIQGMKLSKPFACVARLRDLFDLKDQRLIPVLLINDVQQQQQQLQKQPVC